MTVKVDDILATLDEERINNILLIPKCYKKFTGKELLLEYPINIEALWNSQVAIVAHDNRSDPIFFFGNAKALQIFEMDFRSFTQIPSRLSAEPSTQYEREKLLARVYLHGFIEDYEGIRISSTGKRFRIQKASVWNLTDEEGEIRGQAAAFSNWVPL